MTAPASPVRETDIVAADGRRLHVYEGGDPDGDLVLVHHGTPSCGLLAPDWVSDAVDRGIRLVSTTRPGYGQSERQPGRRVVDVAADAAAVVDALGVERFRTWGISGGGPHALACAAALPDRVIAAASLASIAPYDSPGLDWMAGMGQDNVEELGAALTGEAELRPYLNEQREQILETTAPELTAVFETLLPPADVAVLTGDRAEFLLASMSTALQFGCDGWFDDDIAFTTDWGFDLDAITVPLLILQGEQDLMVPFAHGRWLASQCPGAEAVLSPEDGHLTLMKSIGRVHDWLLLREPARGAASAVQRS